MCDTMISHLRGIVNVASTYTKSKCVFLMHHISSKCDNALSHSADWLTDIFIHKQSLNYYVALHSSKLSVSFSASPSSNMATAFLFRLISRAVDTLRFKISALNTPRILLSLISFGSIGYATLIKCIMPPLSQLLLLDFLLITHSFVRSCYNKRLPISTYDQFRYKTTNIKSLNWTMIVKIANQR